MCVTGLSPSRCSVLVLWKRLKTKIFERSSANRSTTATGEFEESSGKFLFWRLPGSWELGDSVGPPNTQAFSLLQRTHTAMRWESLLLWHPTTTRCLEILWTTA